MYSRAREASSTRLLSITVEHYDVWMGRLVLSQGVARFQDRSLTALGELCYCSAVMQGVACELCPACSMCITSFVLGRVPLWHICTFAVDAEILVYHH
jgi:hypothetical protein